MRIIYLSPHLDDAVLSAGGLIHAQATAGIPVEIWTFMAGFPGPGELPEFAQVMHRIWGFGSARECLMTRRLEDEHAAAEVGARAVHFDFLDAIYRRGKQGQALYPDVMVSISPEDAGLPAQIAEVIREELYPDDEVICQLAIGGHVDHRIVRQAAEMLHRPVTYDADMPYLINHPDDLEVATAGLQAASYPVSEADFRCWTAGIERYVSQIDSVFGSHDAMLAAMEEYWRRQGGIRLWTTSGRDAAAQ